MKLSLVVLFSLLALCICDTNLMSLYHYSETTFLNLKPKSRKVRVNFYNMNGRDLMGNLNSILGSLNETKVKETTNGGYHLENAEVGTILLDSKVLTTGFLNAPNGIRAQQGWILSEAEYPSDEYIAGDLMSFKKLKEVFGNVNKFSVDIMVENDPKFLKNILLNRLRQENIEIINQSENTFINTKLQYSSGFLEKILKRNEKGEYIYNPTMEELFNDFVIRQGLELHDKQRKSLYWSSSIEDLKKEFIQMSYVHPEYNIDITPILLNQKFVDESILKKLKTVEKGDFIRFNELKKYFIKGIKRAAGLVKATEFLGSFIGDNAISEISSIEVDYIRRIREYLKKRRRLHIKYIVMNVEECPKFHNSESWSLRRWYNEKADDFVLGYVESNVFGHAPLIIPGDVVIWHQRAEHRFNFLARYNPSLINVNIIHFLENKWFEYEFWEDYCPGFLPKTKLLLNLLPEGVSKDNVPPELFLKLANEHFPNGWIIKGVWDYNGINHVITHKLDVVQLHRDYKNSTFDDYMSELKRTLQGCEPIEDINMEARSHKNFVGWKIDHLLRDASSTFIQEFKPLKRENRVECAAGDCPIDCMDNDEGFTDSKASEREYKTKINGFFMKCMNSLPENLRGIPLTSDAAILDDGSPTENFVTIETNPGGNGYGIHNDKIVAKCHNNVVRKFPNKYKFDRTSVTRGIVSLEEQMNFLNEKIEKWNIDMGIISPQFLPFLKDRFIDSSVKLHPIRFDRLNYHGARKLAPPVLTSKARNNLITSELTYMTKNVLKFCERSPAILFETFYFLNIHKELWDRGIQTFHETVQKECKDILVNKFAEKMKKKLSKLSKKKLKRKSQIHKLGRTILEINERVLNLKLLNLPHDELANLTNDIKLNKYFFDWKKILFPKLEKTFSTLKTSFERGMKISALKKATKSLKKIPSNLKIMKATERSEHEIQGFAYSQLTDHWDYLLRELYPTLDKYQHKVIKQNKDYMRFHRVLVRAVMALIIETTDSLYSLNPNYFKLENEFLKKSLKLALQIHDFTLLGDLVYTLNLLNDEIDDELKQGIEKARFLIYYHENTVVEDLDPHFTPSSLGALRANAKINLPKIQLKFGEVLPPSQFWSRLKQFGWKINQ